MAERVTSTAPVDAILLGGHDSGAGGYNEPKFTLEFGGQTTLTTVLKAIDEAEAIDGVFFVGQAELIEGETRNREKLYTLVPDTGSLWGNLHAAIEEQQRYGHGREVLVICSDLPFLTAQSLDWLVAKSSGTDSLQIPIIPQAILQKLSLFYKTYYWPMSEFPFKWSNVLLLDTNTFPNHGLKQLIARYRETSADNYALLALKRIQLLYEYGGAEAVYTLVINYASKMLQSKRDNGNGQVPFTRLRSKSDYERMLSRIIGSDCTLLRTPFPGLALDVDGKTRQEILQRGYWAIRTLVEEQAEAVMAEP